MQFPESWLRQFCNPPLSTQGLADLLTMSGMEVESLAPVAPPFTGVVVGEIVSAKPHPQADRLQICEVNAGAAGQGLLQIVCGAPNARVGIKVPLAIVGAALPPPAGSSDGQAFKIGVGQLRGVDSFGMLCSARELGITEDHGGLLELAAEAPPGQDIRQWLQLDDSLFTLKLTPNLAHGLSLLGVAREVSALTGAPLTLPAIEAVAVTHEQRLPVEVAANDLCGRFSGRVIRGLNTQAVTPAWMVQRLERCGQRSVSALVDISNYVMFELGQPTHIFDLDKINGGLVVRWGQAGESLKLLNGSTVQLDEKVGVIADAQHVESLAGIMGGDATAVSDDTRNIYVEAAFWWPEAVAGRSRRYNFSTDAGHRFERGVDPARTQASIERITQLIVEVCGTADTRVGPLDDQVLKLPAAQPVSLRVARAAKIIGMPVTQQQCADVFRRLGLEFTEAPGVLTVVPPSWRFDLRIEEDLIEEVVRVIGYDQLPTTPPLAPVVPQARSESRRSVHALRHRMAALDFMETISFSFVEEKLETGLAGNALPIRVLNPIAAPLSVMRSSLMGSLLAVLRNNLSRKAARVRVFEVGRVFMRDNNVVDGPLTVAGVHQPMRLAGLAWGAADSLQWAAKTRPVDFFDIKGDLQSLLAPLQPTFVAAEHPALHPGRCAAVMLPGPQGMAVVGHVGELHPRWCQDWELASAPMLFEIELDSAQQLTVPQFKPVQRQQSVWRDMALVVGDSVLHDTLMLALQADPSGVVRQALLFDVYQPGQATSGMAAQERSLAIRLELLDPHKPLSETQIDAAVAAALQRAQSLGARLRG